MNKAKKCPSKICNLGFITNTLLVCTVCNGDGVIPDNSGLKLLQKSKR